MPELRSDTTSKDNSSIVAVGEDVSGVETTACGIVGVETDQSLKVADGETCDDKNQELSPHVTISESVSDVKKLCVNCGGVCQKKKRCKKCKSGCYCSSSCRRAHSVTHTELCTYIQELEQIERCKQVFSVREASQVDVSNRLCSERPIWDGARSRE